MKSLKNIKNSASRNADLKFETDGTTYSQNDGLIFQSNYGQSNNKDMGKKMLVVPKSSNKGFYERKR